MTSDTEPAGSTRISFYQLFYQDRTLTIQIPMIQRDYAQGRPEESEVRKRFLDRLHQSLTTTVPTDLDFVYGRVDIQGTKRLFIPLDGQQRLTTLFLLHWYLSHLDRRRQDFRRFFSDSESHSRFSYATRTNSEDFCNALVNEDIDLNNLLPADDNNMNSLSRTIQNMSWYFYQWNWKCIKKHYYR